MEPKREHGKTGNKFFDEMKVGLFPRHAEPSLGQQACNKRVHSPMVRKSSMLSHMHLAGAEDREHHIATRSRETCERNRAAPRGQSTLFPRGRRGLLLVAARIDSTHIVASH